MAACSSGETFEQILEDSVWVKEAWVSAEKEQLGKVVITDMNNDNTFISLSWSEFVRLNAEMLSIYLL